MGKEPLSEEWHRKHVAIAHLAVCLCCACTHVHLGVKRLIDVHSVVLALLDESVPTFPDKSCWGVRVDGAAQEHRLLLVVAATHIADGLVHRQNWCVKVCKAQQRSKRKKHEDTDIAAGDNYCLLHPRNLFIMGFSVPQRKINHIKKLQSWVKE